MPNKKVCVSFGILIFLQILILKNTKKIYFHFKIQKIKLKYEAFDFFVGLNGVIEKHRADCDPGIMPKFCGTGRKLSILDCYRDHNTSRAGQCYWLDLDQAGN